MDSEVIARMEKLLDRELAPHEKERLTRIQNILGVRDNDELWSIMTAMEYQRAYYEELPEKIKGVATEVVKQIATVTDQDVTGAKSRLAESIAEHAKNLAFQLHRNTLVQWSVVGVAALLLYGGLMQWSGFCLGSGHIKPLPVILRLPLGLPIAALSFGASIAVGWQAINEAACDDKRWVKRLAVSIAFFVPALSVFIMTFH